MSDPQGGIFWEGPSLKGWSNTRGLSAIHLSDASALDVLGLDQAVSLGIHTGLCAHGLSARENVITQPSIEDQGGLLEQLAFQFQWSPAPLCIVQHTRAIQANFAIHARIC